MSFQVQNLKPRDPNQAVLASKRNAGGPMRDKKQELKRGESKHKGRMYEGRRHVYGPGSDELKDHPNKTMSALFKGPVKAHTRSGYANIVKVQWFPGGMNYKMDREVKLSDGDMSLWVPENEVKIS